MSEEDLEKVVTIKENNLLKVSLPNEVIYLKIKEISKIDPLNIKQNIVNLIYSTIINEIKNNYEIEVNNQEILNYKNAYLWSENFLRYGKSNTIFYKLKSKFKDISILESVIGGENKGRYSIIFFNIVENIEIYENYAIKIIKKLRSIPQ